MTANMNRLVNAGFEPAGKWLMTDRGLGLILHDTIAQESNVLYAFVVDGALAYVGKTSQSLQKRMQGYKSPPANTNNGASTNRKNNRNIITALSVGYTVDIFVMRTQHSQHHGEFEVSLSAGLEDSLITTLSPPWNGRGLAYLPTSVLAQEVEPYISSAKNSVLNAQFADTRLSANPIIQGTSMTPSAETLFAFARNQQGETLLTLRRKSPFRVEVVGNLLEITPGSSKAPRRESRESVAAVLARFDKTVSFQMSDYQELSFNASYLLALLKHWQVSKRQSPETKA